jgi:NAD(P)-dependent dehydrogenase (short-subunit alcohol dehydrogenase family)
VRPRCLSRGTASPGRIRLRRSRIPEKSQLQTQLMKNAALMKRAAHPDEIVGLALYLASDASSFVTGATINIDGGLVPR